MKTYLDVEVFGDRYGLIIVPTFDQLVERLRDFRETWNLAEVEQAVHDLGLGSGTQRVMSRNGQSTMSIRQVPVIDLDAVKVGDIVQVTPHKSIGESRDTEPGLQPWQAEVMDVDVPGDRVLVSQRHQREGRWIDRDKFLNPEETLRLSHPGRPDGFTWVRIVNEHPAAQRRQLEQELSRAENVVHAYTVQVEKVSYKDRADLAERLRFALSVYTRLAQRTFAELAKAQSATENH